MKRVVRSRRHRNPQQHGGNEKKHTPFFSKAESKPFFNGSIQTKLAWPSGRLIIGKPGDKYEKEADSMADAVVHNSGAKPLIQNKKINSIQRESLATPQEGEKPGTAEQRMEEDKLVQEKSTIQKKEPLEEEGILNRKKEPEEEERMINKIEGEEEEPLQAKSNTPAQTSGKNLSRQLKIKSGKGKGLSKNTKAEMEPSFGTDFSQVNIHTDDEAVNMNKALGAQAFTYGENVYFNSGKFEPNSIQGRHLLAHELTHVVQQNTLKQISREAETDAIGNYTNNFIFRQNAFFRRVKRAVSDGTLTDGEITDLKARAIRRNGTVKHVELLLMAAMKNPINVALLNSHSSGNFIISMTAISSSDRDYVMNLDREAVPLDIQGLMLRRHLAAMGLSTEDAATLDSEIELRIFQEIEAAGGSSFKNQAEKIVTHLMSGSIVSPIEVFKAMLNAASDNTVLTEILTAPPTSKISGDVTTDLGNPIAVIDANLRNAIINMKDSSGRNLYNPASNTRMEGAAGHFFH